MVNCELLTKIQITQADIVSLFFWCRGLFLYYFADQYNNLHHYYFVSRGWIVIDEIGRTIRAQGSFKFDSEDDLWVWVCQMVRILLTMPWFDNNKKSGACSRPNENKWVIILVCYAPSFCSCKSYLSVSVHGHCRLCMGCYILHICLEDSHFDLNKTYKQVLCISWK